MDTNKIIIRMPNWLGDAVMATAALEDVKSHFSSSQVTVLCHEAIASLLQANPSIDHYLVFDKNKKESEKKRIYQALQEERFDLGILLTNSFSSAWWFYKGGVKSRVGYNSHFRRPLLTSAVPIRKNHEKEHQVIAYKHLLSPLGIPLSTTAPHLYVRTEEEAQAKKLLASLQISSSHILIGINPLAAYGDAKCWPLDRFRALSEKLLQNPQVRIIYIGDPSGRESIEKNLLGLGPRVVSLAGKTSLRELLALMNQCTCFVTNDSGPMHIASALHIPLVALFGSTNEIKTGPYEKAIVIHKHVACSPCYQRHCPIDFRCMKTIAAEEVFQAIKTEIPAL
ncbi:MAG: lipopolysaccharide heptosyltransferase II [Verrucomicrobia bacterium]|nr:lipopolysaccharide heptosyltransferase II [Verrucomicrobiota bacterium]